MDENEELSIINVKQFQDTSTEDNTEGRAGNSKSMEEDLDTEHQDVEKIELEDVSRRKSTRRRTERAATDIDDETEVKAEEQATARISTWEKTTVTSTIKEPNTMVWEVELESVPRTKSTRGEVAKTFEEDHFTEHEDNDVELEVTVSVKLGQN